MGLSPSYPSRCPSPRVLSLPLPSLALLEALVRSCWEEVGTKPSWNLEPGQLLDRINVAHWMKGYRGAAEA